MQNKSANLKPVLLIQTLVIAAFLFFQNGGLSLYKPLNEKQATSIVVAENEIDKVKSEFKKIESKDDKLLIYKLFAGAADYLKVCEQLNNTSQFDSILGKVQSSYGWKREKYPEFTTAVSDYLVSVDYDTPKELKTKEQRIAFAEIFSALAEATKYE